MLLYYFVHIIHAALVIVFLLKNLCWVIFKIYMCVYIYIYRERERGREGEIKGQDAPKHLHKLTGIHAYTFKHLYLHLFFFLSACLYIYIYVDDNIYIYIYILFVDKTTKAMVGCPELEVIMLRHRNHAWTVCPHLMKSLEGAKLLLAQPYGVEHSGEEIYDCHSHNTKALRTN